MVQLFTSDGVGPILQRPASQYLVALEERLVTPRAFVEAIHLVLGGEKSGSPTR